MTVSVNDTRGGDRYDLAVARDDALEASMTHSPTPLPTLDGGAVSSIRAPLADDQAMVRAGPSDDLELIEIEVSS